MRPIKYTTKELKAIQKQLKEKLHSSTLVYPSAKLNFSFDIDTKLKDEDKPTIILSDRASSIIKALVDECTTEVAWNGIVTRNKERNTYVVDDIIMFPQLVTGTSVDVDETKYSNWIAEQLMNNEHFNDIRFHGHSHVNMATNPSGIDTKYQEDMLTQVQDYYIYMIFNKRGDMYACIYDLEANKFYERDDIIIKSTINPYTAIAKQMLEDNVSKAAPAVTTSTYYKGYPSYGSYSGLYYGAQNNTNYSPSDFVKDTRTENEKMVDEIIESAKKRTVGGKK